MENKLDGNAAGGNLQEIFLFSLRVERQIGPFKPTVVDNRRSHFGGSPVQSARALDRRVKSRDQARWDTKERDGLPP